uniref:Rho guanine nucleotide exchange factor 37 n=1 Tax=Varanus komodoensis TaxID=61221 RepID=A0A8D2LC07_VARKO
MANDSTEELPVQAEDPEAEEHIYETVEWPDKAEQNQRLAVEELINTEASYVHNLQLCIGDIRRHLQKKQLPQMDLEGLFSNIDDVLCVSKHFLRGLEEAVNHKHDEQLLHISTLFQELKEEMENVYKTYCSNYDQALLLLESYRKDPRLQKEMLLTGSAAGASDLSFFLVMPVQRVTKYPLLLQKILENTPASNSAYEALRAAANAMIDVNANINEYKRRKEVADKYNKPGYLTLRERLARLNTHSIAKKTTRLSRLFMHEAGIVSKTEDKEFDELEEKFQWLASAVADLKQNVASFLSNLEVILLQPQRLSICYWYCGGYQDFRNRLEDLVYLPLCNLTETMKGPQKLIKKRFDKQLDYEEFEEKRNDTGSVTYEEQVAMNTYLAINSLLVSELPVFNHVTLQWLGHILHSFVALQSDLAKKVLQEAEEESGSSLQLPHSHLPDAEFWKMVKDTLSRAEDQLHPFHKKFETVSPSPVVQPLSPAEEKKVLLLLSKHSPEKLFQVISNTTSNKAMDLTLQKGQIVALLHGQDTKGNPNRWLVDTGGTVRLSLPTGLFFSTYRGDITEVVSAREVLIEWPQGRSQMYLAPNPTCLSSSHPLFFVIAAYSFTARSDHEVSLQAGQPVTVLQPHDKMGNKEWSLVEVNGQQGYVPSSFLATVSVPEPPGWSSPVWSFPAQQT